MFKKLFGKKGSVSDESDSKKRGKLERAQTVDTAAMSKRSQDDVVASAVSNKPSSGSKPSSSKNRPESKDGVKKRKKKQKKTAEVSIDTEIPLEYPTTPEMIMEYHNKKPFLSQNEEWLLVELNEYECLVDSEEIIKIIAKHSKFFELDPPELWEEFFEFVEDVPSYDEVINYDVWQEFRDKCYPC